MSSRSCSPSPPSRSSAAPRCSAEERQHRSRHKKETTPFAKRPAQVNPVEGTDEVQDKNGVTIAVSSTPFAPLKTIRKDYKQLSTVFVERAI